jgi:hypothetical protein
MYPSPVMMVMLVLQILAIPPLVVCILLRIVTDASMPLEELNSAHLKVETGASHKSAIPQQETVTLYARCYVTIRAIVPPISAKQEYVSSTVWIATTMILALMTAVML